MKLVSDLEEFVMRLKSLHNIDGYLLEPEFDIENQKRFVREPVQYLLAADDEKRAVIWRELEKRHAHNLDVIARRIRESAS